MIFLRYIHKVLYHKLQKTPIILAIEYSEPELAKYLIEKGADIFVTDNVSILY